MTALTAAQTTSVQHPSPAAASGIHAPLGLRDDPFPLDPLAGAWVDLPSRRPAIATIAAFLDSGEPGLAIVGGVRGAGQTRLLHRIANDQTARRLGIVADDGARRSDAQLLRATIVALGGRPASRTGLELAAEVRAIFETHRHDARMPVLFIDNAALTGSQLEIVRSILATSDEEIRVQIVLLGPPELADRVARRRSLSRFLRESVTLDPLGLDEARLLLDTRIAGMRLPGGDSGDLLTQDASTRIRQETGGVPGAIVTLARRCLREAIATGEMPIARETVDRVLASPDEVTEVAIEGPIQTRLTLPGMDDPAAPSRRRGRLR